jgi:hypothetical protein
MRSNGLVATADADPATEELNAIMLAWSMKKIKISIQTIVTSNGREDYCPYIKVDRRLWLLSRETNIIMVYEINRTYLFIEKEIECRERPKRKQCRTIPAINSLNTLLSEYGFNGIPAAFVRSWVHLSCKVDHLDLHSFLDNINGNKNEAAWEQDQYAIRARAELPHDLCGHAAEEVASEGRRLKERNSFKKLLCKLKKISSMRE